MFGRSVSGLSSKRKDLVSPVADERMPYSYEAQKRCINTFIRVCNNDNETSWILHPLYTLLSDLGHLSPLADMAHSSSTNAPTGQLVYGEDCARVFQSAFKLCVSDRSNPTSHSRRKGVYRTACLTLGWYLKIDRPNLSKQLVRAVTADPTIPSLSSFKMSDQVSWNFYLGLLAFRAGDDALAATHLGWAFDHCHHLARRNQHLILLHLVPARLSIGVFPSLRLSNHFPRIKTLFGPFIKAIRQGDVKAYDLALERLQSTQVGIRGGVDVGVWMALERGRQVCVRGLLRGVWVASDKASRIPTSAFLIALHSQGLADIDQDEVECLLANMIYKVSMATQDCLQDWPLTM